MEGTLAPTTHQSFAHGKLHWWGNASHRNEVEPKAVAENKIGWIDRQYTAKPLFSSDHTAAARRCRVGDRLLVGDGVVYYTTDGTDPRARRQRLRQCVARHIGEPIAVDGTTTITREPAMDGD